MFKYEWLCSLDCRVKPGIKKFKQIPEKYQGVSNVYHLILACSLFRDFLVVHLFAEIKIHDYDIFL